MRIFFNKHTHVRRRLYRNSHRLLTDLLQHSVKRLVGWVQPSWYETTQDHGLLADVGTYFDKSFHSSDAAHNGTQST